MAEYDGDPYCRIDISVIQKRHPDFIGMKDSTLLYYLRLWAYARETLHERLPDVINTLDTGRLAVVGMVDRRSIDGHNKVLTSRGLVQTDEQGRITVCGIKKKHPKLRWKDDEVSPPNRVEYNRVEKSRVKIKDSPPKKPAGDSKKNPLFDDVANAYAKNLSVSRDREFDHKHGKVIGWVINTFAEKADVNAATLIELATRKGAEILDLYRWCNAYKGKWGKYPDECIGYWKWVEGLERRERRKHGEPEDAGAILERSLGGVPHD